MKQLKNIAIKLHKISGSLMSLMFCVWVISGIVLVFHNFPHASKEKRFLHLSVFKPNQIAQLTAPSEDWGSEMILEMAGNKAVYRVPSGRRAEKVYDAFSLKPMSLFSAEYADSLSSSYVGSKVSRIEKLESLDQWIPWSYYRPLLPFYKCTITDDACSEVYVSAQSGSILQRTTRKERFFAWIGIIPHKLYFYSLINDRTAWKSIILVLAALGLIVSFSGILMGFIRLRKRSRGGMTPYKKFHYKWHHLTGFFFGFFLFTFLLSGLFSVTGIPDWLVGVNTKPKTGIEWELKSSSVAASFVAPGKIVQEISDKQGVRRLEWTKVLDESQVRVYYDDYQRPDVYVLADGTLEPAEEKTREEIVANAKQLFPQRAFDAYWQTAYDNYYFQKGMGFQPLPVCRLEFDDPSETILYIDAVTGDEVYRTTRNKRARRWLYRALHTFNFPFLKDCEWLRSTLLIIVSLGILVLSVTGIVLGNKWIWRKLKPK